MLAISLLSAADVSLWVLLLSELLELSLLIALLNSDAEMLPLPSLSRALNKASLDVELESWTGGGGGGGGAVRELGGSPGRRPAILVFCGVCLVQRRERQDCKCWSYIHLPLLCDASGSQVPERQRSVTI